MPTLFDPAQAGDLHLANRIVMAPLTRNRAPGALPTALMATYYAQRASAGLLITEATAISPTAQGYADVPGLWSEEQVAAWKPSPTPSTPRAGASWCSCGMWGGSRMWTCNRAARRRSPRPPSRRGPKPC
jgi:hypothetical protein